MHTLIILLCCAISSLFFSAAHGQGFLKRSNKKLNQYQIRFSINLNFGNSRYAQTTGGEQNWKQPKLKGHRAVIEYNQGSGYKLSVPLGQTSIVVFDGVNFATEQDMMNTANQIYIDSIKTQLGEK